MPMLLRCRQHCAQKCKYTQVCITIHAENELVPSVMCGVHGMYASELLSDQTLYKNTLLF